MTTAPSTRDVQAMLATISPDVGRDEWLRVGMALMVESDRRRIAFR